jgi:hypothetical protein
MQLGSVRNTILSFAIFTTLWRFPRNSSALSLGLFNPHAMFTSPSIEKIAGISFDFHFIRL